MPHDRGILGSAVGLGGRAAFRLPAGRPGAVPAPGTHGVPVTDALRGTTLSDRASARKVVLR